MLRNIKSARSDLALAMLPGSTGRRGLVAFGCLSLAIFAFAMVPAHAADDDAETATAETATADASGASNESPAVEAPKPSQSASSDEDVIAYINKMIRQGWKDNGLTPSKPASEGEWCRRVYLDVLGRIPTAEEVNQFVSTKDKNKKAKLIDQLLNHDQYIEDYARNWTTIWTNILIGRTGGTGNNTIISRVGMQQYLRRSFLQNKPYDKMAFELVSAQGVSTPGEPDYNGAVNFILNNLDEMATPATAKTARIFLGLQVQCTQCHNHPFNNWKQEQFWSMNAFFRQTRSQNASDTRQMVSTRLQDVDFPGEGSDPNDAEIYYELRNGLLKVAYPVFVDGTRIETSGYVNQVNRRTELANLIRQSPYLGNAMVNRMWGHFLGYGFTKPVDDMGPHNPASHPELVERLGQDFALHGYDIKQLIKWITLSEAYGLSSRYTKANAKDDPTLGERPAFSHFYMRQMTAEQLYDSLIAATQADKVRGSYEDQERTKNMWLQQFSVAFGTDENDEGTTFNGTIPQTLMMMNGELVVKATNCEPGTYLHTIATSNMKNEDKITQLYMAALARKPSKQELGVADAVLTAHKGNAVAAMQDIWWVLLNANEFILNH